LFFFSSVISIDNFVDVEGYDNNTFLAIGQLLYGDILLEINQNNTLDGLKLGIDGTNKGRWNFPINTTVSDNYGIVEYNNGTMSIFFAIDDFSWAILSSPLEDPVKYGKKI
jgi:hypothetical protein